MRSDRHEVSLYMEESLNKTRRDFVETVGSLCQRLSLPRSTGQIYGLLYLSPSPLALDDIASLLSISKASASTGTRQLVQWQAVREVWVPGNRRDHFEAIGDLRQLLRVGYEEFFRPKLDKSGRKLGGLLSTLEEDFRAGNVPEAEYRLCRERLTHLTSLQARALRLLPLAEKLF